MVVGTHGVLQHGNPACSAQKKGRGCVCVTLWEGVLYSGKYSPLLIHARVITAMIPCVHITIAGREPAKLWDLMQLQNIIMF